MRCPYCSEDVHDDALRCKACHGDLLLYRHLRKQIEAELSDAQQDADVAMAATHDAGIPQPDEAASGEPLSAGFPFAPAAWAAIAGCVFLLVLAYFVVGIVLRADGLPLRVISILVPLPLGLWFAFTGRPSQLAMLAASLGVPTVAMLCGRVVASLWAGEPLLGREHTATYLLSYWASMGLSFLTGAYMGIFLHRSIRTKRRKGKSNGRERSLPTEMIALAKEVGPMLGPIATAVASFATGVGEYLSK